MTFIVTGTPPAAMLEQAPMAAGSMPTVRFTLGSDGKRLGAQVELVVDPASEEAAMLAGTRMIAGWTVDSDSVSIAMSIPEPMRPLLSSMLAPGVATPPMGYQVSFKLPDVEDAVKERTDKFDDDATDDVSAVSLGTKAVVGGIPCEEWRVTSPRDTATVCAAESSLPGMAMFDWLVQRTDTRDAVDGMAKRLFGGRKLIPIRAVASDGSFRIELEQAVASPPPASFFAVPAGYHIMDAGALPFPSDDS